MGNKSNMSHKQPQYHLSLTLFCENAGLAAALVNPHQGYPTTDKQT